MPFAHRGSHQLHYEVLGDERAPPVLLIMGLGLASSAWDRLPQKLAARFRVIVFDNRGTGRSSLGRRPFRIASLADDAAAVLDAAGVDRAHVFGISMGGMIALELVHRHPHRLRALALGCTYANFLKSRKASLKTIARLVRADLTDPSRRTDRLVDILVSEATYLAHAPRVDAWLARLQRAGPLTTTLQLLAILLHAADDRLHRIQVPTLILSGDSDRLAPVENSRELFRRIPGARMVEYRGVGHCFPVEREDETVAALSEFFLPGEGELTPRR